ncbi:hypothetical protein COSHB9_00500 [Companilactobacillus alimentarius]|nr:hypothetical protein LAL01_12720 [Companilactobacillus alimentarius]
MSVLVDFDEELLLLQPASNRATPVVASNKAFFMFKILHISAGSIITCSKNLREIFPFWILSNVTICVSYLKPADKFLQNKIKR